MAAVGLLIAGGSILATSPNLGRILALVGYVLFAFILCGLVGIEVYLWRQRKRFIQSSRRVSQSHPVTSTKLSGAQILLGGLMASPFLLVRTIFGILETATENDPDSIWHPIYGSALAFGLMALLMEYIAICIWLWVGYMMSPDRGVDDTVWRGLEMSPVQTKEAA